MGETINLRVEEGRTAQPLHTSVTHPKKTNNPDKSNPKDHAWSTLRKPVKTSLVSYGVKAFHGSSPKTSPLVMRSGLECFSKNLGF